MLWRLFFIVFLSFTSGCQAYQPGKIFNTDAVQLENQIWQDVNYWRLQHDLGVLVWQKDIYHTAKSYSEDMAHRDFFAHFDPDGRNVKERLWTTGVDFMKAGENLAFVKQVPFTSQQVIASWVSSPKHLHNLCNDQYNATAVAVYILANRCYITQIFATLACP